MRNMRHQKANSQETKTFSDEEKETDTERSYVFVYQTPDGRTCQTQNETDTRSVTELEQIGNLVVGIVVFIRIIVRGIRKRW